MFKFLHPLFVAILGSLVWAMPHALAAEYIKKSATDGAYNIVVIGDSLAVGLWQGLHQNFGDIEKPVVHVEREAKVNTGLVRSDRFDWPRQVERLAKRSDFQIAVIMFGGNDAQSIRLPGKRHHYKTPGWEEHYRKRVDRIIQALKKKNIAVYWVGLPNVKKASYREDFLHVNAIFKERAEESGVQFIDTWDVTNDEQGRFRPYGKTVDGKKAVLRAKDGTHFTAAGYRILARYAEEAVRRDLTKSDTKIAEDVLKKADH